MYHARPNSAQLSYMKENHITLSVSYDYGTTESHYAVELWRAGVGILLRLEFGCIPDYYTVDTLLENALKESGYVDEKKGGEA